MLTMINIEGMKTPTECCQEIASRVKKRRKSIKLSQSQLSSKSGVSLGSIKRFETSGEISLKSLMKLAFALHCEDDFTSLFEKKFYASIQEVIDENAETD